MIRIDRGAIREAAKYETYLKRFKPKSGKPKLSALLERADGLIATDARSAANVYAAAIATELGRGSSVRQAVQRARDVLQAALQNALPLGGGHGPVGHAAIFRHERERPG